MASNGDKCKASDNHNDDELQHVPEVGERLLSYDTIDKVWNIPPEASKQTDMHQKQSCNQASEPSVA